MGTYAYVRPRTPGLADGGSGRPRRSTGAGTFGALQIRGQRRKEDQRIPDDPVVGTRRVRLVRGGTHEGHVLNLEFPGRLRLLALVPGASWLTAMASPDGHRRLRKRTSGHLGLPASA